MVAGCQLLEMDLINEDEWTNWTYDDEWTNFMNFKVVIVVELDLCIFCLVVIYVLSYCCLVVIVELNLCIVDRKILKQISLKK